MIEADALCKRFGAVDAAREISFVASDGRITGLLGPNGAGKSTTLRLLYGVLQPDRGEARIDGLRMAGEAGAARARIGALPHSAGLYANLTGRENIAYYGALQGQSGAALHAAVEALVARLELRDFVDRRAKGYSQGQRVKVALARALIHDPANLILDEPTNGLDVMAVRNLRALLVDLRSEGRCILLSSHVMQEVSALCDRIVIIASGRVCADDAPEAILEKTGAASLEEAFLRVQLQAGAAP
ncbi:MAG: ATP-binding cassette domain-containing protein [Gammaproteobacteria bacterium]|nr:ATP-binding cassette domain-containing protein [Gammaproteobacteria bacterium]